MVLLEMWLCNSLIPKEKRDKFQGFNERIAGMPAEQIKKIRNRIGIAGGVERVKAVKGAIAGGYINILITNNECAEKLL